MTYLLFGIYLVFFSALITRIPFFRNAQIPSRWLIAMFWLKIAAGMAYGWYYTQIPEYAIRADTWKFYFDALPETALLKKDPLAFFSGLLQNHHENGFRHLFSTVHSYWNDLKHEIMVKFMAVLNVFTGSRYYVNVVWYNFLTLWGPVAFIRIMNDVFPGKPKLITLGTFLFPSFLFWLSGIHKEGILFTLLALTIYIIYRSLQQRPFTLRNGLAILFFLLVLFGLRNYMVLAALPAFAAWWLAEKYRKLKWWPFAGVFLLGCIVFFGTPQIHRKLNLPLSLVQRQQEFMHLGGQSVMPLRKLEPNLRSFVVNAPQALNHAIARPYLSEIYSPLYALAAVEIFVAWMLFACWYFRHSENPYRHPVNLALLMLSLLVLLLTGYIVPQMGAIVRYRSIFFPFVMVPILCTIKWNENKLKNILIF